MERDNRPQAGQAAARSLDAISSTSPGLEWSGAREARRSRRIAPKSSAEVRSVDRPIDSRYPSTAPTSL